MGQAAGVRPASPTMGDRRLRCNQPGSRVPWLGGTPVSWIFCGGQAAAAFPAIGKWPRAGIAAPALSRAATRFVSSG